MMDPSWIFDAFCFVWNVSVLLGAWKVRTLTAWRCKKIDRAFSGCSSWQKTRHSENSTLGRVQVCPGLVQVEWRHGGVVYLGASQKLGGTWRDSKCETAQDNNQLWIGRGGSLTPCHYDKAENLHMQICGQKTFLLIPPDQTFVPGLQLQKLLLKIVCNCVCTDDVEIYWCITVCFLRLCTLILSIILWTLSPWWILMRQICNDSRQDQKLCEVISVNVSYGVNCKHWRLIWGFDRFAHLKPFEVTLEPGDLLYLPKYWWHQVAQGAGFTHFTALSKNWKRPNRSFVRNNSMTRFSLFWYIWSWSSVLVMFLYIVLHRKETYIQCRTHGHRNDFKPNTQIVLPALLDTATRWLWCRAQWQYFAEFLVCPKAGRPDEHLVTPEVYCSFHQAPESLETN